jgi:WD40 repeat protein
VNLVTFLADRIATASSNYTVSLWEAEKGTLYASLEAHTDLITAINISLGRKYVATASEDNTVRIWLLRKGRAIEPLEKVLTYGTIRTLSFSENGSYLNTDRGYLRPKCLPQSPGKTLSDFYVRIKWITRGTTKFLRLPPGYKPSAVAVHDNVIVLGHESGNLSFLTFDLLLKRSDTGNLSLLTNISSEKGKNGA